MRPDELIRLGSFGWKWIFEKLRKIPVHSAKDALAREYAIRTAVRIRLIRRHTKHGVAAEIEMCHAGLHTRQRVVILARIPVFIVPHAQKHAPARKLAWLDHVRIRSIGDVVA